MFLHTLEGKKKTYLSLIFLLLYPIIGLSLVFSASTCLWIAGLQLRAPLFACALETLNSEGIRRAREKGSCPLWFYILPAYVRFQI
ncbi:hypothetical protein JHK86_004586 [Glycine max]|nr:hypothetical protein JHK86_004586 [Glycine max]